MPVTGSLSIPRDDLTIAVNRSKMKSRYVGTRLFPEYQVPATAGRLGVVPLEALYEVPDDKRQSDGTYNRTNWKPSDDSYATTERGLEEALDDRKAANYRSYFDFEKIRMLRLTEMILRLEDQRIRDLCHDTTNFTGSTNTLSVGTSWATPSSATPVADLLTGINAIYGKCGLAPNFFEASDVSLVLQISFKTWLDLSQCNQIIDKIKYGRVVDGRMDLTALAGALNVNEVVVSDAVYNSADSGLTASLSSSWSRDKAFLAIVNKGQDPEAPCIGRTLYWNEVGGNQKIYVEDYREEQSRGGVLRVRHDTQEKRWSTLFGFLFTNVNGGTA